LFLIAKFLEGKLRTASSLQKELSLYLRKQAKVATPSFPRSISSAVRMGPEVFELIRHQWFSTCKVVWPQLLRLMHPSQ